MIDVESHSKKLDLLSAMLISTVKIRAQLATFTVVDHHAPSWRDFNLDCIHELLDQIDLELEVIQRMVQCDKVFDPAAPVPPPQPIVCPSCGGAPTELPVIATASIKCKYCGCSWHR